MPNCLLPKNLGKLGLSIGLFGYFAIAIACGNKRGGGDDGPAPGPIAKAFSKAEATNKVPQRFLYAVAYLESNMSASKSYSLYLGESKGFSLGETAFGQTRKDLGIDADATADSMTTQVAAYAAWLAKALSEVQLNPQASTFQDKFNWIWEIAQRQRTSSAGHRNILILFAREMATILNNGFTWKDPVTGEVVTLPKENPPISLTEFPYQLEKGSGKIFSATRLRFVGGNAAARVQVPQGIEVVHCPLSLSACIEMQSRSAATDNIVLNAHYVVPPDNSVIDMPIQLEEEELALPRTQDDGTIGYSNHVVFMLTGMSGRVVNGQRELVNPSWFTTWQLQRMGEVIGDVCEGLAKGGPNAMNWDACVTPGSGTFFRIPSEKGFFKWGDIADFDQDIYAAYLKKPDGLSSDTKFKFDAQDHIYDKGSINVDLAIPLSVRRIAIQHMVRCNNQISWQDTLNMPVRSLNDYRFQVNLFDSGPNANGSHFYRAKVFGKNDELLGWDTAPVYLRSFETQDDTTNDDCG